MDGRIWFWKASKGNIYSVLSAHLPFQYGRSNNRKICICISLINSMLMSHGSVWEVKWDIKLFSMNMLCLYKLHLLISSVLYASLISIFVPIWIHLFTLNHDKNLFHASLVLARKVVVGACVWNMMSVFTHRKLKDFVKYTNLSSMMMELSLREQKMSFRKFSNDFCCCLD